MDVAVIRWLRDHRYVVAYLLIGLTIRVLYAAYGPTNTFDWTEYRAPIAERLSEGEVLYRDVPYDHMPLYPYYTALAYSLFGESYLALMSLAIVGDSLIAPFLFHKTRNHWIAILYIVSVVSIVSCGNARWDGLTVLFLLMAISHDEDRRFGLFTAIGITLKQYPVVALVRVLLGKAELKKLLYTAVTVLVILLPFLVFFPGDFVDNLFGHSVYQMEEEQERLRVGMFINHISEEVWAFMFSAMAVITLWTFRLNNYRNTVGILVFLITFMMFVTHKHTEMIFVPFTLLLLQRSRYWIFAYLFVQYFILMRMRKLPEVDFLLPLTFVIWFFLVRENILILGDSYAEPHDILLASKGGG
jgi:hypothetical protein